MSVPEIIVIGGGVSGLSCAHELASAGYRVALWTAELPAHTTSMVAAAFWYPYRAEPAARVGPWGAHSYRRFVHLAESEAGPRAGVFMREVLEVFPERVEDPPWSHDVRGFRHARADERIEGYAHAIILETPVIEMPRYLPWLVEQVRALGVEIVERRLDSLAPALAAASVVVNTTGLGARELVGDTSLYAVRGQVLRHERGELERVLVDDHGPHGLAYIVPRGEDVILGGTAEERVERMDIDPEQSEAIYSRCARLQPALSDTQRLGVAVGLRPCRASVRVEAETLGDQRVIHNYGHGGAGVTLSWGCAAEVVTLARSPR